MFSPSFIQTDLQSLMKIIPTESDQESDDVIECGPSGLGILT